MSPATLRSILGLAFVGVLAASIVAGAPSVGDLPQVALSWPLLLHVERATALIGVLSITVLIAWRACDGTFPIRMGNLEYAIEDATLETNDALEIQDRRIDHLESIVGLSPERVVSRRGDE